MAAAYRPSSGAEWEGADRSAAAAEVSQGCGGVGGVLLHRVEWCGCRMAGRVGSDPRSRPELPHNIKDSARGWQRAQRGRCRRQEAEPTAEGADFTRGARSIRRGLGAGPSSSALPGVARPGALHPRAVLLRQDTHRANLRRNV